MDISIEHAQELFEITRACKGITIHLDENDDLELSPEAVDIVKAGLMNLAKESKLPQNGSFICQFSPGQVYAINESLKVAIQFAPKHLATENMSGMLKRMRAQFDKMLEFLPKIH